MKNRFFTLMLCFILLILAAFPASSADNGKDANSLSADEIKYNTITGEASAKGHVVITMNNAVLRGDKATGNTEKGYVTLKGNVDGNFPQEGITLKANSVKWNEDKSKKSDGRVEAVGNVYLTKKPKDFISAQYLDWTVGNDIYRAKGKVNAVIAQKILKAEEITRIKSKLWAKNIYRYEDTVNKYIISANFLEGRIETNSNNKDNMIKELIAEKNVVLNYTDKDNQHIKITGDKALYSKLRGTLVISGNTKAVGSDGRIVTADTMVIREETRSVEARGNSKIEFTIQKKDKNTSSEDKREEVTEYKPLIKDEEFEDNVKEKHDADILNSPDITEDDKGWIEEKNE